ncbi:hypothetical protein BHUM_01739 [Candidatus Burkholderia humilis]|nr:hypothetical protein BHUM_01739 [Candidatus Burkholderia humilis]
MQQRTTARNNDPAVRTVRAAVRAFFHWRDAVSVIEHALLGTGMALVDAAVLQLFYFAMHPLYARPGNGTSVRDTPVALRWSLTTGAAVLLAVLCWSAAYPGTRMLMAAAAVALASVVLDKPGCARRLSQTQPECFVAVAGTLPWLGFELAWKLYQ